MNILSEIEKAWIAGFFDGEGNLCYTTNTNGKSDKKYRYWNATAYNTNTDVLYKLQSVTGIGNVRMKQESNSTWKRNKDVWYWRVSKKQDVYDLCEAIAPYSVVKKEQIDKVLCGIV
jgi:hypothetical protein